MTVPIPNPASLTALPQGCIKREGLGDSSAGLAKAFITWLFFSESGPLTNNFTSHQKKLTLFSTASKIACHLRVSFCLLDKKNIQQGLPCFFLKKNGQQKVLIFIH